MYNKSYCSNVVFSLKTLIHAYIVCVYHFRKHVTMLYNIYEKFNDIENMG